jgi:hypothetical protein
VSLRQRSQRAISKKLLVGLCSFGALALGLAGPQASATTVEELQYGFSFSLPAAWAEVPLSGALVDKFIRVAAKDDPRLEKALGNEVEQATKQHLKVLAVGPPTGGFFPNLNIGVEGSPSLSVGSLATLLPLLQAQVKELLSSIGARELKVFTTKLRFGTAVEANYGFPLAAQPGHLAQGIQLYVVHGPRLYVLTFTAETQPQDVAVARVVEASWRWA